MQYFDNYSTWSHDILLQLVHVGLDGGSVGLPLHHSLRGKVQGADVWPRGKSHFLRPEVLKLCVSARCTDVSLLQAFSFAPPDELSVDAEVLHDEGT